MTEKKLLILGGTQISLQILYAAKELGIKVFVTDYNSDSPCKQYADKSFMVSATDVDSVVELIKSEKIDGVLMGYADVLLPYYVEICEKAGLPCYANKHAIEITTDKRKFKEYCREHKVSVVDEYRYEDVIEGKVNFPLIIKPVDNSGARGIFICHDLQEFHQHYNEALSYSKSKQIIIERMMTGKEATIFYYLHQGKSYLIGIGDRWMYTQDSKLLNLPIGYTFPSILIEKYMCSQDADVKEMFSSLGMNEGMVFMQAFVEDNRYIIYEMGYRLTGSIEHHIFDRQYGFNHLKEIINYAVGNPVNTTEIERLDPTKCCMANVTLLLKEGIVKDYKGLKELKTVPGVVNYHISHNIGTKIDDTKIGKLAQVGVRILLVEDSHEKLLSSMDRVKDMIQVISNDGTDLVIRDYQYSNLCV